MLTLSRVEVANVKNSTSINIEEIALASHNLNVIIINRILWGSFFSKQ